MKYKRRKTAVSEYISRSEEKNRKKGKSKIFLFFLLIPMALSLLFSYATPGILSLSKTAGLVRAVSKDAVSYISDKLSFLSRLGQKGADFCFEYIRGEEKDSVLAVSSLTEDEKKKRSENDSSNTSHNKADAPATEAEIPFTPSLPCEGEISSPFGERVHPLSGEITSHNGIDIAVSEGTTIGAIESGTVEKSEYNQFSGNYIVIRHINGYTSSYAHLSLSGVKAGDWVEKGYIIGTSGSTGAVTGPHLHMEIRKDGVPVDPMSLIKVN